MIKIKKDEFKNMKFGINIDVKNLRKRKCDYCEKDAKYICDFIGSKTIKRIAGCDEHKYVALEDQQMACSLEKLSQGRNWSLKDKNVIYGKSMYPKKFSQADGKIKEIHSKNLERDLGIVYLSLLIFMVLFMIFMIIKF